MLLVCRYSLSLLMVLLVASTTNAQVDQMALPVRVQIPLFMKILSYDKSLTAQSDDVVIGIAYQKRFRASTLVKDDVLSTLDRSSFTIAGRTIRPIPVELEAHQDLNQPVIEHEIDVLYITPLRAFDVSRIAQVSRNHKIITMTGVPEYVHLGLSVSADVRDNKPSILINLPVSKAEGARFHSQLLKLAEIIR